MREKGRREARYAHPGDQGRDAAGDVTGTRWGPPLSRRRHRRLAGRGVPLALVGLLALGACSLDGLLKSDALPPDVTDPAITETPAGARAAYLGALGGFQTAFGSASSFIIETGLLSDELTGRGSGGPATGNPVDLRRVDRLDEDRSTLVSTFLTLNVARQRARQARGLVGDYLPEDPALQAHLYALEGYTEVMLAELYCSGIPLSTVDYQGDYTLRPGSSTEQVFTHAAALFDTAIGLAAATDSVDILHLSRVGRARALVGLGDYVAAAAAVSSVGDDFRYTLKYAPSSKQGTQGLGWLGNGTQSGFWSDNTVPDREGTNGLAWRTSGDPRARVTQRTVGGFTAYHPDKYRTDGNDTIVLASGVEARLIAAEAALQASPDDGAWRGTLNALRTDGSETRFTEDPTDDPAATYTYWRPGSGGVDSLAPLVDPGSDTARVSLLFRERAFWLFLTGHRQGDLRRLVRQYQRPQSDVYPVGAGEFGGVYGQYIDLPIPLVEGESNPLFTGCFSRD